MRKLTLWLLAAFLFASCDNLKAKNSSSEDDTEETTKKKKKKALDEEEESADEESTTKKKKKSSDDEDVSEDEPGSDEETTSDYAKGWSNAEQKEFMDKCTEGTVSSMGQEKGEEYCSCMLDKLQKRYPKANDAQEMTQSEMTKLAKTCL